MIIDSHVHLWDARVFPLRWTKGSSTLDRSHESAEYRLEAAPLGIDNSVVIEVDVDAAQRRAEADDQIARCASGRDGVIACVPCLDPRQPDFLEQLRTLQVFPMVRGVRWIARTPAFATELTTSTLVRSNLIQLGKLNLTFDLNVPIAQFAMLPSLVQACPETRFVLDHFGYADPLAFVQHPSRAPSHDATSWLRTMEALAANPNVCCKVSGLANRLPAGLCNAAAIAPIVEHARSVFGAQRLLFGSDWPVIGPAGFLTAWVNALKAVCSRWTGEEQDQLFAGAARHWYQLSVLERVLR
jgi:L-fuconolactonase